jgi:hypothetical protein
MSTAAGHVEQYVVLGRLQQTGRFLQVVTAGKSGTLDITFRRAAELFPDFILEILGHSFLLE